MIIQRFVVDQHAADERVRLERLEAAVDERIVRVHRALAKPQTWVLAPHEIRTARAYQKQIEKWGFQWEYSSRDERILWFLCYITTNGN